MNSTIWWLLIIIVLIAVGFWYYAYYYSPGNANTTGSSSPSSTDTGGISSTNSGSASTSAPVANGGTVKSFTVTEQNYSLSPSTITVDRGDTVEITVNDKNGVHDFVIDGLNVATQHLNTGQSQTLRFVASQSGTFTYYCSVDDHRGQGMVGKLIVK